VLLNHPGHPPVDLNATDSKRWSALHWACYNGHLNVIKLLLAHPVEVPLDLNAASHTGETALHVASWYGYVDVVQALLNYPRHQAVDVNSTAIDGKTPLHYAASAGYNAVVKVLLEHGAGLNTRTRDGRTALMLVSQNRKGRDRERKRATESYLLSLPGIDLEGYSYPQDS